MGHALTAQGAAGLGDIARSRDAHGSVARAAHEVPDAQRLDLLADLDATHALDALVVVANKGIRVVPRTPGEVAAQRQVIDVEVVGERLKRAVARAHAAGARSVMLREEQLDVHAAGAAHLLAVGVDDHVVEHVVVARGDELVDAFDLDDADTARPHLVELTQVAQRGDGNARGPGGVEDRGVLGHLDLAVVDDEPHGLVARKRGRGGRPGGTHDAVVYHCSILPPRNAPKPK